jgi:hypothetical protein
MRSARWASRYLSSSRAPSAPACGAIIRAARLLDAPVLKEAMASSRASLGIITSDFVYDTAIKHAGGWTDPDRYMSVQAIVKESSIPAWMRLIDPGELHSTTVDDLTPLLKRTSVLKRQLVEFATEPRFDRYLTPLLNDVANPDGQMTEPEFIQVLDAFIMQHRFKDGSSVIDRFLQSRRDIDPGDRQMLLAWRSPVQGVFELIGTEGGASMLLNLIDDLRYRVYSNTGVTLTEMGPDVGFATARLVPLTGDAWLISGNVQTFPLQASRQVAEMAIEMATEYPEFVFRNPEKVRLGWERMRADRERFIAYFGGDEVVLPPADAQARMDGYLGASPFQLPESVYEHDTVGIIFDQNDGLIFLPGYGTLHELFADPRLLAERDHAEALKGYLKSDSITPAPLRRLAAAYPANADALFGRYLRKPAFRWATDGEALLRKSKPWYFAREPRPNVSVISDHLYSLSR